MTVSNVLAIAAGWQHSVALKNDGTMVAWGDNSYGQTNVPGTLSNIKLIAAGGDHTLASTFSPTVMYPVEVTKDLLLIYNTNSADSTFVKDYYLAHRPMVSGANVLGIGCSMNEAIQPAEYTNTIAVPVQNWLAANPTKWPAYVILFPDIPSQVVSDSETSVCGFTADNDAYKTECTQYRLNSECASGWCPFVTHINMNGTNDCIAYINKLESIGTNYSPGKLIISASAGGYGNTNYYFDNTANIGVTWNVSGINASNAVVQAGASPASVVYTDVVDSGLADHLTNGVNVAGYLCFGSHSSLGPNYATNAFVRWSGNSGWWVIETVESFNGQVVQNSPQGNFIKWFSSTAFGGTNYSNTPVGAVCYTEEPGGDSAINNETIYFGEWEAGRIFAKCAWNSRIPPLTTFNVQAVGDPFVRK